MLRNIFIAILAASLCFGFAGIAFSGESLKDRDLFVFDSTTTHGSMDVADKGHMATQHTDHNTDMSDKGQPCVVVLADAGSINDVNRECIDKYRELYGG